MKTTLLLPLLLLPLLSQAAPRRFAVVVGANESAIGRTRLRYSHRDAKNVADVLALAGHVAPQDMAVLLDPEPQQVLGALEDKLAAAKSAGGESMLVFYYSGHADDAALYPRGKPLAFSALKQRLEDGRSTLRIGIIDACRGGAWTRAKGLTPDAPFEVDVPLELASEGAVLIASSSGTENAHESDLLQGSFFTHHLVAGMRGAADQSADGQVSLNEAFAYAQQMTVRDTAMFSDMPQHPSFDMDLRGRYDVALTQMDTSPSVLNLSQSEGPLQVVQLQTGLVMLELPSGKRAAKLSLAPGKYLVRRRLADSTFAKEVAIEANGTVLVEEEALELVGQAALATKRFPEPHAAVSTTLPAGRWELNVALGVQRGSSLLVGRPIVAGFAGDLDLQLGLTERLQWPVARPALVYRLGDHGAQELVGWAGITGYGAGWSSREGFVANAVGGAGMTYRHWLSDASALNLGFDVTSRGVWSQVPSELNRTFDTWAGKLQAGFSRTLFDTVTLNLGIALAQNMVVGGQAFWTAGPGHELTLGIGSVQQIGLRPLPLVQVHVSDAFTLDGHAQVSWNIEHGRLDDQFMLGFTWTPGGKRQR